MFDIWAFLLQTLTASGVAAFLLVIKGLFKDKLPPKWHFLVWSSLGLMVLLPSGLYGRYTLFRWQVVVEIIKGCFGDYSFTRVLFPIPFLKAVPETFLDWIFVVYVLGVVIFAAKYIISYVRLRHVLRKGTILHDETLNRMQQIAIGHRIKLCKVIEVSGLPSAFVCGVIRPILAVPAEGELDDKVILHELFHLKHRDTFWSVVICLLRCIHWCNPLLIYCANRAINDMESRCDQYVLECLEGEERRDYGRILLSMSNDQFVKTPGSTCINNGRKNIRDRIEAIARFKKYPVGMGLVSGCIIIVLILSLAGGAQAGSVYDFGSSLQIAMASARSTPCTTYAGAFDTYAKAILDQNGVYRAMCAPASMQADIIHEMYAKDKEGTYPNWDCNLNERPSTHGGYYIYNLKHVEKNVYEGLLVIQINYPPGSQAEEERKTYLAVQNLRVEKENGRWVTVPLENFRNISVSDQYLEWGCPDLSGFTFSGTASNIQIDVTMQTIHYVDSWVVENDNTFYMLFGSIKNFDITPKPDAVFTTAQRIQFSNITHLGTGSERNDIRQIGLSVAPVFSGETRPENLHAAVGTYSSGGSSSGRDWFSRTLDPGWGPTFYQGGSGGSFDPAGDNELPEYYAADLYLNNKLVAQIDLHLQEGVKE